ncbi:hypothetical protein [Streptomyces sp. NPDC047061]|uniref:hypothetical protein n=1 Tax=Streptomyces sp. NPDC047061 TaxID=3154605 RepID=UPI0033DEF914
MTGIEIAVGYVFAYLVGKAKRVAGRADQEVDRTLDAGMDRLHGLISRKLGEDPALRRLAEEAEAGQDQLSDRTRQRVQLALEDAAQDDLGFAQALNQAVQQLEAIVHTAGTASAGDGGQAVSGNVHIEARDNSAAALNMGNVTLGNPPQPGPSQG